MSFNRPAHSSCRTRTVKAAALAILFAGSSLAAADAAVRVGWVWADQPSAVAAYTPDTNYSYNSTGEGVTVTPLSTGSYRVTFTNLGSALNDHVQVTAYGSTNGYCQSNGWSGGNGGSVDAYVNCYDASGAPANQYFTVLYQAHSGTLGNNIRGLAYVWAYGVSQTGSYTPTSYTYNSTGGANSVKRTGVGLYTVKIPGLNKVGGTVQVTYYGSTPGRCKTSGWGSTAAGTTVEVLCFDATGTPTDAAFDLLYSRKLPLAFQSLTATNGMFAWASQPNNASYETSGPYSFNSYGTGRVTASHSIKGQYDVNYDDPGTYSTSNVIVTAYGTNNSYCNVGSWFSITVYCWAQGGAATNSQFDVGYQTH